jgi:hypothetical protein
MVRAARYAAARASAPPGADAAQRVALDSDDAIPPPAIGAREIELTHGAATVARVLPDDGRWNGALVEQLAQTVPWKVVRELELERAPAPPPSGAATPAISTIEWTGSGCAFEHALEKVATELVALVAPGERLAPGWADDAAALLGGPRVDAVAGGALPRGEPPAPAFLRARYRERHPYASAPAVPRYLIVRRDQLRAVGGVGPRAEGLSLPAAVAEVVERVLGSGGLVAIVDLAAFERPSSSLARLCEATAAERARGGVVWRRAGERGAPRGGLGVMRAEVLPVLVRLPRADARRRVWLLARLAAFLSALPSASGRAAPRPADRG